MSFPEFYRYWIGKLKVYLALLFTTSKYAPTIDEEDKKNIISTLATHFQDYYTTKSIAVDEDVLQFFNPKWLNPWEIAHLWVTGWKPSSLFRIIDLLEKNNPNMERLSDLQINKVEELRAKMKIDEEKVDEEMRMVHMTLVDRNMVALAQRATEVKDNIDSDSLWETTLVDEEAKILLGRYNERLAKVVKSSDNLRLEFLHCVFEILNPSQCIGFLVGMCVFELTKMI